MAPGHRGRNIALITTSTVIVVMCMVGFIYRQEIKAQYEFWRKFESIGVNTQGYPEFRHRQTGIVFVRLPGGTFLMGSPEDERGRHEDEGPVHEVTLSPFMIAKFEVTQLQWEKVMGKGSNPSRFKGMDLPVEQVSWDALHAGGGFLERTGFLLPTEAQWEYACRAGVSKPYSGNIDDLGWHSDNSGRKAHPVGQKKPNAFGLYDMHGNVCEWCEDDYDNNFYSKPEASGPNPVSNAGSGQQVARGGSWGYHVWLCRSAFRDKDIPSDRDSDIGFRVAFYLIPN